MADSTPGPKFSEYGLRYYTNSLTKEETRELHKWRMKNDPEYREKNKIDRLRKKATASKKTPTKKTSTAKSKATSKARGGTRGGAGLGSVPGMGLRGKTLR